MNAPYALRHHGRFDYSGIPGRPGFDWPQGRRLAIYLALNLEHFSFGDGLGACLAPPTPQPDVLNYAWREYGNRVGAWRLLELFDELRLPCAALVNTSLLDHCPSLVAACVERGHELVGHGHTNAQRQGEMDEAQERALLAYCRDRLARAGGRAPAGWLSPWISESVRTPDLLVECGYGYTLNWCHDDQPVPMRTRGGQPLWSIPYPQELNDIPAMMARLMSGAEFADMVVDQFDEMLRQSEGQPLVMGIALHPYIVGQPHRLRHLRRALQHLAAHGGERTWWTTPGAIFEWVESRPA
ncbi:MAG: polysaccharide deacetylase family protein [Burkholderiales bacterium]|nr:polysaccharide deacetylase family protein [Burkholderiales bacterium]